MVSVDWERADFGKYGWLFENGDAERGVRGVRIGEDGLEGEDGSNGFRRIAVESECRFAGRSGMSETVFAGASSSIMPSEDMDDCDSLVDEDEVVAVVDTEEFDACPPGGSDSLLWTPISPSCARSLPTSCTPSLIPESTLLCDEESASADEREAEEPRLT